MPSKQNRQALISPATPSELHWQTSSSDRSSPEIDPRANYDDAISSNQIIHDEARLEDAVELSTTFDQDMTITDNNALNEQSNLRYRSSTTHVPASGDASISHRSAGHQEWSDSHMGDMSPTNAENLAQEQSWAFPWPALPALSQEMDLDTLSANSEDSSEATPRAGSPTREHGATEVGGNLEGSVKSHPNTYQQFEEIRSDKHFSRLGWTLELLLSDLEASKTIPSKMIARYEDLLTACEPTRQSESNLILLFEATLNAVGTDQTRKFREPCWVFSPPVRFETKKCCLLCYVDEFELKRTKPRVIFAKNWFCCWCGHGDQDIKLDVGCANCSHIRCPGCTLKQGAGGLAKSNVDDTALWACPDPASSSDEEEDFILRRRRQ